MPKQIITTVYTFDELSDKAKEKAREWYREGALDYEWWDYIFDDFQTITDALGFTIDTRRGSNERAIYFSGFCSQGDGACFEGSFCAKDFDLGKLTKHLGDIDKHPDKDLSRIVIQFHAFVREHPAFAATLNHTGHYCHSHSVSIDWEEWGTDEDGDDESIVTAETGEVFDELARGLMNWLYRTLKDEHDWLLADEQVDESIRANGYTFTGTGKREG